MPLSTKAEDVGHALCIEQFGLKSVLLRKLYLRFVIKDCYILYNVIVIYLSVMMILAFVFNLDDLALIMFLKGLRLNGC